MKQDQTSRTTKMMVALKDITSSPFRDFKINPLRENALEALEESYEKTGYWGNIVLRKLGKGKYEIISGHHRFEILKKTYKGNLDTECEFDVVDLASASVQKRMAREHHPAYNHDVTDMVERVKGAVLSLAAGELSAEDMPAPDPKTNKNVIRYAPSYVAGRMPSGADSAPHTYTTDSIARFLGSTKKRREGSLMASDEVVAALAFLENLELKLWDAKAIATFRRPDGSIPVDTVLKACQDKQLRAEKTRQNETQKAEAARVAGLTLQQQVDRANAEKKKRDAELAKTVAAELAAREEQDKKEIARLKQKSIDDKKAKDAADAKCKQAQKEWDANEKTRLAAIDHERQERIKAAQRAEASRASYLNALCESFDRIGGPDDPLYGRSKDHGRDKRTTDSERNACIHALELAAERIMQMRVFFRPELGKKKR